MTDKQKTQIGHQEDVLKSLVDAKIVPPTVTEVNELNAAQPVFSNEALKIARKYRDKLAVDDANLSQVESCHSGFRRSLMAYMGWAFEPGALQYPGGDKDPDPHMLPTRVTVTWGAPEPFTVNVNVFRVPHLTLEEMEKGVSRMWYIAEYAHSRQSDYPTVRVQDGFVDPIEARIISGEIKPVGEISGKIIEGNVTIIPQSRPDVP